MTRTYLWMVLALWTTGLCVGGCAGTGPIGGPALSHDKLRHRVREVLTAATQHSEPAIRCNALESLALLDDVTAAPLVREHLSETVPAVRFAAVVAAGDLRDHAARTMLEKLLTDPDDSVRLGAGYALEQLGDNRFMHWYDRALFGADPQLASQACVLLGKLGNTALRGESQTKLWKVIQKDGQNPIVRLQAAEALARLGDERVIKKLMAYAASSYADDRLIAIYGLALLGGENAQAMLTVLVEDSQLEVQLAAAGALGPDATDKERDMVRRAVGYVDPDGDPQATARVRGLALMALGQLGQDSDATLIHHTLDDDDPYVRVAAARGGIDFLRRSQAPTGR